MTEGSVSIEELKSYLSGTASAVQIQQIERLMQEDESLIDLLQALDQAADEGIDIAEVAVLQQNLQAHWDNFVQPKVALQQKTVAKRRKLRILPLAAAIILCVVAGFLIWNATNDHRAIDPYPNRIAMRNSNTNSRTPIVQAMEFYDHQAYQEAIPLFESYNAQQHFDPAGLFYLGLCYLFEDDYNKAAHQLQQVIQHNDNLFIDPAQYYLAWIYAKENRAAEAKTILQQLVERPGEFKDRAQKLLSKI